MVDPPGCYCSNAFLEWNFKASIKALYMHTIINTRPKDLLMRLSYKFLQTFPRASSRTARYGVAVVSSGAVLFVCLLLDRALTGNVPLTLFIISVAVSALLGGLGPGLLATLLCGAASPYFLTPHFSVYEMDTADWERLGLFLATSVLLSWLFETARTARQEVEARALEAVQRQKELEA